ncbi:hypothetical protein T484DRAFT_1801880 [Baffinella frigidus]|nr:hypothetical protein T484DRAFT_1801880 [Cryptophyta sp. CCMP2293]
MAGLVREMIDVEDLAKVHTTEHGRRAVAGEAGRKNGFEKRWTTAINQPKYRERLDACIRGFVRDFVPAAIDAERHGYTEICYQAMPSLRIHMPHAAETQAHIALHKDYDYFHQPNEINFWIPLLHKDYHYFHEPNEINFWIPLVLPHPGALLG